MGAKQTLTALVGGFLCVTPACADVSDLGGEGGEGIPNDPSEGSDGSADGSSGDDEVATIAVQGFVGEWLEGFPPLEGVTMSIVDHPEIPTVVTDANGMYVFPEVPANSDIIVHAQGEDDRHPAASRTFAVGDADHEMYPMFLVDRAVTDYIYQQAGLTYDPTLGGIAGGVWKVSDEVFLDAQVALSPSSGTLVYNAVGGLPDPTATGVTADGTWVIRNVEAGEYELTASHPDASRCWAEGPDQPEAVRVRTFPDTLTFSMGFTCD